MAKVHITNVSVLDNPSQFNSPFKFEVTFEAIEDLSEDLEWKVIYVGSAETEEHDQVLDTVFVGPVPEGRHMFVFDAPAPDTSRIPERDALGVTVVLVTCAYRGQEFVRVGYYVNNDYTDPELKETPPESPRWELVQRNILASSPRVTRFKIEWSEQTPGGGGSNGDGAVCESSVFDSVPTKTVPPAIDLAVHNQLPSDIDVDENTMELASRPPAVVAPCGGGDSNAEEFMDFSL